MWPPSTQEDGTVDAKPNRSRAAKPVGAILIERFEGLSTSGLTRHRSEVVAKQSAAALKNALEHSNLPFLPVLRLVGKVGWHLKLRQLPRTALVLGTLVAAAVALFVVPADFTLEGHEKSVNCVEYYRGGDKPYIISGSDDRFVVLRSSLL